jgi:hypothetical protein
MFHHLTVSFLTCQWGFDESRCADHRGSPTGGCHSRSGYWGGSRRELDQFFAVPDAHRPTGKEYIPEHTVEHSIRNIFIPEQQVLFSILRD